MNEKDKRIREGMKKFKFNPKFSSRKNNPNSDADIFLSSTLPLHKPKFLNKTKKVKGEYNG